MGRRISSTALQASRGGGRVDEYFDRVIKYIPSDLVGAWIAVTGFVPNEKTDPNSTNVLWICFGIGLILTPLWTALQTREKGQPTAVLQIIVATVAFAIWVIALGRPFDTIHGYQQYYGSLLLVAFTVVSGRLVPNQ